MWQYKRVEYKFKNIHEIEPLLNKEGDDDWEIIYYRETKPVKFGEDFISIVLYKSVKK